MKPTIQNGDIIEGTIERVAFGGDGILRHQGMVIFIPFTAPGDQITCKVTDARKSFAKAVLIHIKHPSPFRIQPPCPYFGTCGGCQIQHLNDEAQNHYKLDAVKDALSRIGHLHVQNYSFTPAQQKWAYRRHVTLHIRSQQGVLVAGYIGVDNQTLLPIQTCPIFIQNESVLKQLHEIVGMIPSDYQEGRVTVLKSEQGQFILSFYFESSIEIEGGLFNKILQHYPLIKGMIIKNRNQEKFFGDPFTQIEFEGLFFKITPQTFIQNHPEQSGNINKMIAHLLGFSKKQKILDLYCGFGMTTLLLANQGHHEVIGVEYNSEAIKYAQESNKFNKMHAKFIQGDVRTVLSKLSKDSKPDAIVVNPPRTGVDPAVLNSLLKCEAKEIIYVSCMPSTLARDLAILCKEKYTIHSCHVYDMFPQTAHVESLVYLISK